MVPLMTTLVTLDPLEQVDQPDRLREIIPRYLRAGLLRRTGLPDGGIQFVEVITDRVFATLDGQGRFVSA
jgi:hypothetical protein